MKIRTDWITVLLPQIALWFLSDFIMPRPELITLVWLIVIGAGITASLKGIKAFKERRAIALLLCGQANLLSAAIFVGILFYNFSGPITATNTQAVAGEIKELRVLVFNIDHGYPNFPDHEKRARTLTEGLEYYRPDIVILQDAWNTTKHGHFAEELARRLKMNFVYARATGFKKLIGFEDGQAVLSRYPIKAAERVAVYPQTPFWLTRIVLVTEIALNDRQTLQVINVHLGTNEFVSSEKQVKYLKHYLAGRLYRQPNSFMIAAGDFHENKFSPATQNLIKTYGMRDVMPADTAEDHFLVLDSDNNWFVSRVRFVLSADEIKNRTGEHIELSDHPGFLAEIKLRVR